MASHTTSSFGSGLSDWMQRHDWVLYKEATDAVEREEAFDEGLSVVKKSQLRAVINTARMCQSPSIFKGFLEERAERRRPSSETPKNASQEISDEAKKANFWSALADKIDEVQEEYARPAVKATGVSETDEAEMRVVRAYFEHLISHCHVAGQ